MHAALAQSTDRGSCLILRFLDFFGALLMKFGERRWRTSKIMLEGFPEVARCYDDKRLSLEPVPLVRPSIFVHGTYSVAKDACLV